MALVTSDEVKALIDTSRDVTTFIESADLIVSEDLVDKGLSADRLKQIELYLAAHFVAITEERGALTHAEIGDSNESYQIAKGKGYDMTRFGQQAMDFDTSGTLKTQTKAGKTAVFMVL